MVFILVAPKLFGDYFQARVTLDAREANASSLLYLINWIDIKIRFEEFIILGDGIGHTSSGLKAGNSYVSELKRRYEGVNNSSAGTFITARLVQSIGLFGIVTSIFILFMLSKSFLKTKMKNAIFKDNIQYVLYASLMPAFFFRGTGLLSFSTFLFLLTVVYTFKTRQKSINFRAKYVLID